MAAISVITEIELLCWRSATENDISTINQFIANCDVYELRSDVKLQTIDIRKSSRLKLPDAIIAASAIVHNKILITRNTADFGKIPELEIIDPFTI